MRILRPTTRRAHRGRGMEGRMRYEVFRAGIPRKRTRKLSAKKGGPSCGVEPDLGEPACQVITVPVHPKTTQTGVFVHLRLELLVFRAEWVESSDAGSYSL